jgi:hypothetical protein
VHKESSDWANIEDEVVVICEVRRRVSVAWRLFRSRENPSDSFPISVFHSH